jgi:hypothetical protein
MVLGAIARVVPVQQLSTWPEGEMLVADATAQAAANDLSGRRQAALSVIGQNSGEPIFSTFRVLSGTEAFTILYSHLRVNHGGTANLAENESIAWALTDSTGESVFVTQDKHAALLALAELGRGKVCHPYELWEALLSSNVIDREQFTALMNAVCSRDKSIPDTPWRLRLNP